MATTGHPIRGGTVRLTIPATAAFNLDHLNSILEKAAGRLGHPQCFSGCDFLQIGQEREFLANERFELAAQPSLNPQPLPPGAAGAFEPTAVVTVPAKVSGDIRSLQKAVGLALGKLGCGACCSGFDILFRRELDMVAIDEKLSVTGFGKFH